MKGMGAKGMAAMAGAEAAARILVGETYVEVSSGRLVRVLDSNRSSAGGAVSFVVESADGSRPGQRWLCRGDELAGRQNGAATREVERWAAAFEATREALLRGERLPRCKGGLPLATDVTPLASVLRCMADELVRLARADRGGRGGGSP